MTVETGLRSFTDDQLADELEFAHRERAAGGCLGQRTRVAKRIAALEAEQDRRTIERCWSLPVGGEGL